MSTSPVNELGAAAQGPRRLAPVSLQIVIYSGHVLWIRLVLASAHLMLVGANTYPVAAAPSGV